MEGLVERLKAQHAKERWLLRSREPDYTPFLCTLSTAMRRMTRSVPMGLA